MFLGYEIFFLILYNLFNKLFIFGYLDCYKFLIIINNIEIKIFVKIYLCLFMVIDLG